MGDASRARGSWFDGLTEAGARNDGPVAWLIALSGERQGERFALTGEPVVLGQGEGSDVRLPDPRVAQAHARLFRDDGGVWVIEDASGRHETFVNDLRVTEYALRDGDRIRVGRSILKLVEGEDLDTRCQEELFRLSRLDSLTHVASRSAFTEALERETSRARRHGRPLSLAVLDVDGFSALNDALGEATGSAVLQQLCLRLRPHLRLQDVVARTGDDEFAVLLPESDAEAGLTVARKLHALVNERPFEVEGRSLAVTVSIGVATFAGGDADVEFEGRARAALERARQGRGNSVEG